MLHVHMSDGPLHPSPTAILGLKSGRMALSAAQKCDSVLSKKSMAMYNPNRWQINTEPASSFTKLVNNLPFQKWWQFMQMPVG